MLKRKYLNLWALLFGILISVQMSYSADLFKPTKQEQIKLGEEATQEIKKDKDTKILEGPAAERVRNIADKLLKVLPKERFEPWKWQFHVIENKEINAFALPGGSIFIFSGLLDRMKTDDEVAAVLGHEMSHVYKEDWAYMVRDATNRQLAVAVLLGATKAGKTWRDVAGVGLGLTNLHYSRKDEDEADENALNTIVSAGYNPVGLLNLFETLKSAGGEGMNLELIRSHPLTSNRIKKARERILKINQDRVKKGLEPFELPPEKADPPKKK